MISIRINHTSLIRVLNIEELMNNGIEEDHKFKIGQLVFDDGTKKLFVVVKITKDNIQFDDPLIRLSSNKLNLWKQFIGYFIK